MSQANIRSAFPALSVEGTPCYEYWINLVAQAYHLRLHSVYARLNGAAKEERFWRHREGEFNQWSVSMKGWWKTDGTPNDDTSDESDS